MATIVKDLGPVTAYSDAVAGGYTGTREEWEALMASYASVAQTAIDAKDQAIQAKTAAQAAQVAAEAAQGSAETANTQAQTAAGTATTKAGEAAVSATSASGSAATATTKAGDAAQSAALADESASSASQSATEAATAKTGAESAATRAESAKDRAVQVEESIPADYSELSNDVTSLKTALSDDLTTLEYTANGNLYNVSNIIRNKYINPSTGEITDIQNAAFAYSPTYIPVSSGETIISNNRMFIAYYDRFYNILSALQMDTTKKTVVPEGSVYARFSVSSADHNTVIVQHGQYLNSEKNNYTFNLAGLDIDPTMPGAKQNTSLMNFRLGKNLYNSHNIIRNKYIHPTSGVILDAPNQTFAYSPTYILVTAGEQLIATDRMFIAYYDRFYNILSALQMDTTKKTVVPEGSVYARFSVSAVDHSTVSVQIGNSIDVNAGKYSFSLDGLIIGADDSIVVDAGGNGDYTSLTQAVYENVDNGKTIEVMPGEYDVKAEYIALFGQTVVDNLADDTSGINNFQYGIRIHDRKIVFMPGSKVVCDWTGKTINGTHRFCAFRVEQGAEIEGLYLVCTATFYGIHDDYGPLTPFTIKYKNCRIDCYNLYNANCIGGGCHKYSRHTIENCYFNNHVNSTDIILSADVRYHNTNTADAEPEIYISNCYFSNNFNAAYYGNQTTKMKVYVNNCHAPKGINKVREASTMNVDNVDLYKWNNDESM